ncbi:hypothetical protein CKO35_14310 [Ectothiorhodospira shaposhnikovii]|uniref:hypothetical protein n=1 Tax=Ectothiorhodospira shaposhnikovii TaxID=1054 RepID=UPI0019053DAD|nr:hypothetical protein [Ectothiorhodospira shaposhnikovii]MBK1674447.1 hypothetical protein [Ectothiorhodospira shaposhnikovii]
MSTVLWANRLVDGVVISDGSDKPAIYRHQKKLDAICELCGVQAISSFCDSTDAECNLDVIDLPDGMESTDELMAAQGVWIDSEDAMQILEALILKVRADGIRFGLLRNDHDQVLEELQESYDYAKESAVSGGKFNFSVVM